MRLNFSYHDRNIVYCHIFFPHSRGTHYLPITLDVLQGDVGKLINKVSKNSEGKQDLQKLEELRAKKDNAGTALKDVDDIISAAKKELEELQVELEKLNVEYSVKGGGILKQKSQLMKRRSESLATIASSQEQLLELVAGEMPLILVADLVRDILEKSKVEHEQKINLMAFEKICASYEKFNMKSEVVNGFIDFMKSEMGTSGEEELYGLSDLSLYQVEALNNSGLKQSAKKAKELLMKRNIHQKEVEDIDNSLSVDIDEKLLSELFEDIRGKEREIIKKKVEIENLEKERATLHGMLIMAESEFSKYAENLLSVLESVDADERTVKYAHMAIEIIKLYRIRLQERKTEILAQTMTRCYKKLANKKNLIDYIKMDSKTLDLHYINKEGEEIVKKRLSAGEKQLMVISLLWALAICSKKKLPVIIDTPLSRLDLSHRQALIKTYFPKASDQTIILSTDSEIDENYYALMKKSIGDEFTLEYSDKTKSTTIKSGYFGWEALSHDN